MAHLAIGLACLPVLRYGRGCGRRVRYRKGALINWEFDAHLGARLALPLEVAAFHLPLQVADVHRCKTGSAAGVLGLPRLARSCCGLELRSCSEVWQGKRRRFIKSLGLSAPGIGGGASYRLMHTSAFPRPERPPRDSTRSSTERRCSRRVRTSAPLERDVVRYVLVAHPDQAQ